MLRLLLVILFLICFALFSLIALPVEALIGRFNPHLKQSSSQRIVANAFRIILFLSGTHKTVIGVERIPKNEPVLFVSNHRSYFDVMLAYSSLPHLTGFIAKIEIAKIPILKQWMLNLKCLFLDRENAREGLKTILEGIEQIKEGTSMFIAPEGTRNQNAEMLEFKPGSLKMAEKTGCPIVPVAISHSDRIYELHAPWIRSAHVTIEYGEPIYLSELDAAAKKTLLNDTQETIRLMLAKND